MHTLRSQQSGMALLMVLLTLLLATGSHLVLQHSADQGAKHASAERHARTQKLMQAKKALLFYTVAYADNYLPSGAGPGHLPCPDRSPIGDGNDNNDGPDPPCKATGSNNGRFPRFTYSRDWSDPERAQKRIEFYPEYSLLDQQMWYAVSQSHINNPLNTVVNPVTRGQLKVDSIQDVAAVIIEPGRDLNVGGSARPGDSPEAYLEGENADGDVQFSQLPLSEGNDILIYITASDIMRFTRPRVTQFVRRWLSDYYQRHCGQTDRECYPAAADSSGTCQRGLNQGFLSFTPGSCDHALAENGLLEDIKLARHWFARNNWADFYRYHRHPQCADDIAALCAIFVETDPQGTDILTIRIWPVNSADTAESKSVTRNG